VDCVPIFPPGRNSAKVEAIAEEMKTPGVILLDRERNADHDCSVITILRSGFFPLAPEGGIERSLFDPKCLTALPGEEIRDGLARRPSQTWASRSGP
jgi:hypothetical protein